MLTHKTRSEREVNTLTIPSPTTPPPSTLQYPTVTTYWVETVISSTLTTWVEVIFTQEFQPYPGVTRRPVVNGITTTATDLAWATHTVEITALEDAGVQSGAVGLGTLTGAVGVVRTGEAAVDGEVYWGAPSRASSLHGVWRGGWLWLWGSGWLLLLLLLLLPGGMLGW